MIATIQGLSADEFNPPDCWELLERLAAEVPSDAPLPPAEAKLAASYERTIAALLLELATHYSASGGRRCIALASTIRDRADIFASHSTLTA